MTGDGGTNGHSVWRCAVPGCAQGVGHRTLGHAGLYHGPMTAFRVEVAACGLYVGGNSDEEGG